MQGSVLEVEINLLPRQDDDIHRLCGPDRKCCRAEAVRHELLGTETFRITELLVQYPEILHPVCIKGIGPYALDFAVLKRTDDLPVLAVKFHKVRLHSDGNRVFPVVLIVEADKTVLLDGIEYGLKGIF